MATHWTDKRTAVAMVGQELERRGWKLYGWKDDKSDSMTDYYDPESWDGIAEHRSGAIACVDVGAYLVGSTSGGVKKTRQVDAGPCERCQGKQAEPDGWTHARAKADPPGWDAYRHPGTVPVFGHVVSPLYFFGCAPQGEHYDFPDELHGHEKCHACHGTGRKLRSEEYIDPCPTFQANPKGASWHVERGGRIIARGTGVFAVARERYQNDKPKLAALVDRIEAALERRELADSAQPGQMVGDGVTMRPSSKGRAGYVELRFDSKPCEEIRAELKAAGFRWAKFNRCWYGPESKLPIRWSRGEGHAPDIDLAAGY